MPPCEMRRDHPVASTTLSPGERGWERVRKFPRWLACVLAVAESAVADLAQPGGIVVEGAHMAPVHRVRFYVEVVVAQRGEPDEERVDFGLAGDEGVNGFCLVGSRVSHGRLRRF